MIITINVPLLPPSTNHAFASANGHRFLSKEAKEFKELVKWKVTAARSKGIPGPVMVSLTFYSLKWFTKAGAPRKIDVANLEKLFVDAVFEQLGLEDSHIFDLRLRKLVGPEQSVICITQMETL